MPIAAGRVVRAQRPGVHGRRGIEPRRAEARAAGRVDRVKDEATPVRAARLEAQLVQLEARRRAGQHGRAQVDRDLVR